MDIYAICLIAFMLALVLIIKSSYPFSHRFPRSEKVCKMLTAGLRIITHAALHSLVFGPSWNVGDGQTFDSGFNLKDWVLTVIYTTIFIIVTSSSTITVLATFFTTSDSSPSLTDVFDFNIDVTSEFEIQQPRSIIRLHDSPTLPLYRSDLEQLSH
ncbi:hypothetical protein E4T56_gene12931 [Termitomyces sp. T112]|nr:hypothetical protein E4T56_gene12931 [Termitomyces sp. T112]